MYVGITRARKFLTVTRAQTRSKYGHRAETNPSRFLFEMQGTAPPPGWRAASMQTAEEKAELAAALPAKGRKPGGKGAAKRGGKGPYKGLQIFGGRGPR